MGVSILCQRGQRQNAAKSSTAIWGSVTLGTGQFCTNPGLLIGMEGAGWYYARCSQKVAEEAQPSTMLHQGILILITVAFGSRSDPWCFTSGSNQKSDGSNQAPCQLFEAELDTLFAHPELKEENFGPSSVFLKAQSSNSRQAAESMEGQLTATIHGTEEDLLAHKRLIEILQRKVGRLIFNGFPTGIEVCPSMHHGGPYPATTHSVSPRLERQQSSDLSLPVCFQGFPESNYHWS